MGDSICRPSVDISRLAGQRWARPLSAGSSAAGRMGTNGSATSRRNPHFSAPGNYVASWATLGWVAATAVVPQQETISAPLSELPLSARDRDRGTPRGAAPPHHLAYGSRTSAVRPG